MEKKIKLAVQKSGRLLEGSLGLLKECGIRLNNGRDQLKTEATNFPLEVLFLRNSDIPQYVSDQVAHIAIIGENVIREKRADLTKVINLGFSKCRLSIAVPKNANYKSVMDLQGKKIATSYPNTLGDFLAKHGISAEIHVISGSVEIAPNIGLADAVCDLVSSGSTLLSNGLEEKDVILKSEACLVKTPDMDPGLEPVFDQLLFRINAVLEAQNHKYILLNAPNDRLAEIVRVLPGMKSPTVMPLAVEGWSSVHTVITEQLFWEIIHELKKQGAEGILVIPIEKMIL